MMIRYASSRFSLFILTFLFFVSANAQGWVPNISLDERIRETEFIFEAEVIDQSSSWDSPQNNIYTLNKLLISGSNIPEMIGEMIILVSRGGQVGDDMQICHPAFRLQNGDKGIFFLKQSDENFDLEIDYLEYEAKYSTLSFVAYDQKSNRAWDMFTEYQDLRGSFRDFLIQRGLLGFVNIVEDEELLIRSPNAVIVSSVTPTSISAGTMTELTINGSGFGATRGNGMVEFKNANNGGYTWITPISSEYVSWNNSQIKVEVPNGAGTGKVRVTNNSGEMQESSSTLTVDYNITNITYNSNTHRINLVNLSGGGIEFEFQTSFFNDADAYPSFIRALDTWRCSNYGGTGIYFIDSGSTTTDAAANDGVNVIRFSDDGELNGALAVTSSFYAGCYSGGIVWYLTDVDLTFDETPGSSSFDWNFDEADGSTGYLEYDFESVALHELGHAHQIGHSISAGELMHYNIGNGEERRTFNSDEEDAGDDVLSWSSGVCSNSSMTSGYLCLSLALDIIDFEGEVQGNKIALQAKINDIPDETHVILEKSINGIGFNPIGKMNRLEVENGMDNFDFEDKNPLISNYYRFKFEDADGHEVMSKLIHVAFNSNSEELLLYPNPASNQITLQSKEELISVFISDQMGNRLLSKQMNSRQNIHNIDISALPEGIYILCATTETEVKISRFYCSSTKSN